MKRPKSIPRIVVVGGGAGGLELISHLCRKLGKSKKADIVLVDTSPIHLWKPLLHEVAAGTINTYEDELSYLAYASDNQFQFYQGEMHKLDRQNKFIILAPVLDKSQKIIIPERQIAYDVLVIAVGSVSNDFNIPGVKENCLFLDSSAQALNFQHQFVRILMQLPYQPGPLNIAIIGGGATGVELTAELHYAIHQMSQYGFEFDVNKIHLNLIEASNTLLPGLTSNLSQTVKEELEKLNVKLFLHEKVTNVTKEGIYTQNDNFIPAQVKIWAAGIKAPAFLKNLDLEVNALNQLIVKPTLQTTLDSNIFAMGDCACCILPNHDKPVPPRAQAANQEAAFLVGAITNYIYHKPIKNFIYTDYGSLISLSHYETVGNLMGRITKSLRLEGKLARLAYRGLYRRHQSALYGPLRVCSLLLANLLTRKIRPRLKLH